MCHYGLCLNQLISNDSYSRLIILVVYSILNPLLTTLHTFCCPFSTYPPLAVHFSLLIMLTNILIYIYLNIFHHILILIFATAGRTTAKACVPYNLAPALLLGIILSTAHKRCRGLPGL